MRNLQTARIIAIAGPKGGIGRSTCTVVLARAFAALDSRVLIVDTNGFAGGLSALVDLPPQLPQSTSSFEPAHTSVKNIDLVAIRMTKDSVETQVDNLRKLSYDEVILDLGGGFGRESFDVFLNADLPILLADPEPASIQLATLWLRQICIRFVEIREPECAPYIVPPNDWAFMSAYQNMPAALQARFAKTIESFRCLFVLNRRRENSEILQSQALCHAWGMLLGLNIRFAGSLQFDERRWFFARQLADVSLFKREDPMVRECDEILRTRLNNEHFLPQTCLPLLNAQLQPRQVLRVETADEARQVYRQLWEGYRRDNGMVAQILPSETIAEIIAQLEIARRRAEIDPETEPQTASHTSATIRSHSAELRFAPESCPPDAGKWLTEKRETFGITRSQIALKTRIPQKVIEKLEQRDLSGLTPARLEAYLIEIAKVLGIDPDEIRRRFGF